MISWFKENILLPADVNKSIYFYLIFLMPLFIFMKQYALWRQIVVIFLLIVFLYGYRQGFLPKYQNQKMFHVLLILSSMITLLTGYASIFIYIGFQFPYWTNLQKVYIKNYKLFLMYSMISSGISVLLSWSYIKNDWYWIAFGLVFVVLSPWISWESEINNRVIRALNRDNERLLSIIKQEERQRIARDLHDNMGQSYSMIALKAELADKLLDKDLQKARQEIHEIAETSRAHLSMVRNIVSNLQERTIASSMLDISKMLAYRDIDITVYSEHLVHDWPLKIQDPLAAIIQEAITNVIRHSQASHVQITFSEDQAYHLIIHDNGKGYRMNIEDLPGFGLKGIRQRVQQMGGLLQCINDGGAKLSIKIPKEETTNG